MRPEDLPGPDEERARLGRDPGDDPGGEPRSIEDAVPDLAQVLRAEGDEPPGGPFPSWGHLYLTVLAWAAVVVVLLYVFTATLDFGAR